MNKRIRLNYLNEENGVSITQITSAVLLKQGVHVAIDRVPVEVEIHGSHSCPIACFTKDEVNGETVQYGGGEEMPPIAFEVV